MAANQTICKRCILDHTVPEITYDEKGNCNYCNIHDQLVENYPLGVEGKSLIDDMYSKIKKSGKGNKYDCLVGVSGGTDSSYLLFHAVKNGLRPLAVHFDNGWNSDAAIKNIKNITKGLGVDLYTHVADWEEFKDLQIAFLKASVPDSEVPTDYAIISVLFKVAASENIKYILEGHSFRAEGTTPIGWTYMDGRYIRDIHKKFGKMKKIYSFPILSIYKLLYYLFIKRIKIFKPLEYLDYSKSDAKKILVNELDWTDYGGHHHESVYTKFFQTYFLIKKFNIDKRKREYSARIRSNKIRRNEALEIIGANYQSDTQLLIYIKNKLGFSNNDFNWIMKEQPLSFLEYKSYFKIIQKFRYFIKILIKTHILPPIFYYKYGMDYSTAIIKYWETFNSNKN